MSIPRTVTTALADRPVADAVCLEAGAGVGNTTAGLLAGGASRVYAVTNERKHAKSTLERVRVNTDSATSSPEKVAVLEADLRTIPLPDNSIEIITAHGLFNVVPPADLEPVLTELTRVAAPGCHLVANDYEPLPDDAAVRELFALENAAAELADGQPMLSFYAAATLRRLFVGAGWEYDRTQTLLEPVPWTKSHLEAHAAVVHSRADQLEDAVGEQLCDRADALVETIGFESVGEMYSLAFRWPA
ncbi:class I SAM-dependent methyltransferase [Natronolimnobius sp. AArcel1]|uniref:class I SAM-dependent methyltransferase n=1 Tax=Natronolimnobius sp. AArcel1 TaxID=1679093 RepID=UPI0013ECE6E1|nr:class I SAM-dependent methyltransferase [Natronolimnobius sp. AArcel1]NGM70785.1 class I SAM-dependent methyltransferase [Natronolimnobius sp. AArcel1]